MTEAMEAIFGKGKIHSRMDFIGISREGIPMDTLQRIQEFTSLSSRELSQILTISERQLQQYKPDHVLRKDISSHLLQIIELFERGYKVFGKEKFPIWVRSEILAFGNQKPIDVLDTPIGIQMVLDVIGRIQHGVYN